MSMMPCAASAVLEALNDAGRSTVIEAFDELHASETTLDELRAGLRAARDQESPWGSKCSLLLSWLVARVGPGLSTPSERLEERVDAHAGKLAKPLVMPRWVLAHPVSEALRRRVPCRPLTRGDDEDLYRAYDGLLDHLDHLQQLPLAQQRLEMLNTAIPWRILALVDRLQPEKHREDPIKPRLQTLKWRTIRSGPASSMEREWLDTLNVALCDRRNALSHLGEAYGWTFGRCVDEVWTLDEARQATAGIALAMMAHIAQSLRDSEPPVRALRAVLYDVRVPRDPGAK